MLLPAPAVRYATVPRQRLLVFGRGRRRPSRKLGGGGGRKEFARAGRGLQAERLLYTKSYCLYVVWKCSQPVVIVVTLATTNYVALR